ncbi:MAG: stage III sporulation protein AF, partial [Ruminococcus sp.]|nr:stage III sporulation protein AF [Ruminococcus sp.]
MKELLTVAVVICSSTLICTILSNFITDGSTKKIISLVLGAFIICSLIIPVKNAVNGFNVNVSEHEEQNLQSATDDEAYSKEVIKQTKANLEQTLSDFLLQNGVQTKKCEIILSVTEENSII